MRICLTGAALIGALVSCCTFVADASGADGATFAGLRARELGPAVASGRVTDIAVNPDDHSEWYIAAASGGVWKTNNAGTTFTPIFEGEGSYSIGCVVVDPRDPNVVWVGTGENNSQRSVSFGDGVYKSVDGGASWTNVGLPESEHIGMISIDPRDSDVVYVAAQGPLWRSGGDRGVYKTTNGGQTWSRVLHISDDTGANEVHIDPSDPDTLYASSYQRRRHVWTLINGGPESSIYKSTDAGQTWNKISRGLPNVDLGRIGMDISPADPNVLYAIVEAAEGKSGFFRSTNRGATWHRRSDYVSGSPQYYNEIICDPHDVDRVYALDTYMHVTDNGGASFDRIPMGDRHVDDHALWIDPNDTRHMIVGCDGGVYETFDRAATWRYSPNLSLTQFYKAAYDFSEPFYYIYGGTQDNNTLGGPVQTVDRVGIANEHWFVTVGGDGFEPAVDPEDPNTVYSQWQYGGLIRHDRASGEIVDIRPREAPDEEPYVFNWDSPLIISPHSHTRLYFGGRQVFQSDDRGNSWTAISGDLTRKLNRNMLKVMGVIQGVDAVAKHNSTSIYGNTVAISESPLVEGLIYVGTDDGLIQITEDGGANWRRVEAFPTVPDMTYVSDLFTSRHDPDVVFATFTNHKNGDFTPYILRSDDRGRSWTSIRGDLPDRHVVWGVDQDTVDPNLLFVGTEFAAFFSQDGGETWHKIAGVPTIAVRDVEVHPRENDLIMATFGRGFYILDDYTPLRHATDEALEEDAAIFPVRDAKAYIETSRLGMPSGRGFQGSSYWAAPNPPFGALITFHVKEGLKTLEEQRKEREKGGVTKDNYPTTEEMRAEFEETEPQMILTIHDDAGEVVRRMEVPRRKGLHRVAWDLRYPTYSPTSLTPRRQSPWGPPDAGPLALPGEYTATLTTVVDGESEVIAESEAFEVVPLNLATFSAEDRAAVLAFQQKVGRLQRAAYGAQRAAGEAQERLNYLRQAIFDTPEADLDDLARVEALEDRMNAFRLAMNGDRALSRLNEPSPDAILSRIGTIVGDQWWVSSPPTQTQRDQYGYASDAFDGALDDLQSIVDDIMALEADLENVGAAWTPGRIPDWQPE